MQVENEKYGTRYMCDILKNMRDCCKTLNFSYLSSLIEEAQYRAERMENAIEAYGRNYGGLEDMEKDRIELKEDIRVLKKEKKELEKEIKKLKKNT